MAPKAELVNGHAFTILNNTKTKTIKTNQYTIHASCHRVLQSEYIGIYVAKARACGYR